MRLLRSAFGAIARARDAFDDASSSPTRAEDYEFGDPNGYGVGKCSVEDCNNRCAVTADGLIVTCKSCHRTLCSWCDECDQCASVRKEIEADFTECIYGPQGY